MISVINSLALHFDLPVKLFLFARGEIKQSSGRLHYVECVGNIFVNKIVLFRV